MTGLISSAAMAGEVSFPKIGDPRRLPTVQEQWSGFWSEAPLAVSVLTAVRPVKSCEVALARIEKWRVSEHPLEPTKKFSGEGWDSWKAKERLAIENCAKSPCGVKLDAAEAAELKPLEPSKRVDRYLGLVRARMESYLKTATRKPYEFPGPLVDPWAWLEKRGIGKPSGSSKLYARRLEFAPSFMALRQILDQRTSREGKRVTHWIRDAYTDHYFEGWGEWIEAECLPGAEGEPKLRITQAWVMEFDLFKKTDVISKVARPKMRDALETNSRQIMERRLTGLLPR